jgi:hypothetical protein
LTVSRNAVGICAGLKPGIAPGKPSEIVAAHRDEQGFVVRADERLTAFVEREAAIRATVL